MSAWGDMPVRNGQPPLTDAEDLALQLASVSDARDGYRAVLEVVREALDIPYAATYDGDQKRTEILHRRVTDALIMVQAVLEGNGPTDWNVDYCRERLARNPATGYRVFGAKRHHAGDCWCGDMHLNANAAALYDGGDL